MTTAAVIPVRNRPSFIVKAIKSIQAQTLAVDEIIIVDDGSTDETPAVVDNMALVDQRIRLQRREQSKGASAARNLGVQRSSSEWIAFLDSDDQWLPEKHQMQMAAIANTPECVASFTGIRYEHEHHIDDVPARQTVSMLDLRGRNVLGSTSTSIVRRSAFEAVRGFDETLPSCQDWDLWLRLRAKGEFVMVSDPLIVYDSSDSNRISRNLSHVLEGHKNFFPITLRDVRSASERRFIKSQHLLRLSEIHSDFRDFGRSAQLAFQSFLLRPSKNSASLVRYSLRQYISKDTVV